MSEDPTTVVVQQYLDALGRDQPAEPIVRAVLDRSVGRLRDLCASLLHRSYPRLRRPPLNLERDELLGGVVERLLKAVHAARPATVRQFFALANCHIRWELNDLARRLDEQPAPAELPDDLAAAFSSASGVSPAGRQMLAAIDALPDDEREVFELVRIQGLTHGEAADLMGISTKTVQRRLNRGLVLLTARLKPGATGADAST